jgi:hypothetical protein
MPSLPAVESQIILSSQPGYCLAAMSGRSAGVWCSGSQGSLVIYKLGLDISPYVRLVVGTKTGYILERISAFLISNSLSVSMPKSLSSESFFNWSVKLTSFLRLLEAGFLSLVSIILLPKA